MINLKIYIMKFTQPCFIRMNTPKIREGLAKLGYHICICANFDGAEWIDTLVFNGTVHGIGYFDKEMFGSNWTKEKELNRYLSENKNSIDCKTNIKLFLAIAALTDDTDENQYFVLDTCVSWPSENFQPAGTFILCKRDKWYRDFDKDGSPSVFSSANIPAHKATVSELIEHFK